jgi:hypothetical protein
MWEWYRVGPQSTENGDEYETDLMRPLHCWMSVTPMF